FKVVSHSPSRNAWRVLKAITKRKPPMKEDKAPEEWGQGLFVDSAESLREHLRSSVRQALKELFEEEIRILCGARYHPGGSDYHRAGSSPSYVMTDARREPMDRPRVRRATVDGRS